MKFYPLVVFLILGLILSCSSSRRSQKLMEKGIRLAEKKNDYKGALVYLDKAFQTDSTNLLALANKGSALIDLELFTQARVVLLLAQQKKYEVDGDWYYNMGETYYGESQYAEAIPYYNKAIAFDPDVSDYYLHKAYCYEEEGVADSALASYDKVLRLNPGDFEANKSMGIFYYNNNKLPFAKRYFNIALNIDPSDYYIHLYMYRIFSKENDKVNACIFFNLAKKHGIADSLLNDETLIHCDTK